MKTIPLTKGFSATVDDEDYEALSAFKWWAVQKPNGRVYAIRDTKKSEGRRRRLYMHRLLLGEPAQDVDHADRDGLNNRRENLRLASRSLNNGNGCLRSDNTSGLKGVSWSKARGKWEAMIRIGGTRKHIGRFSDPAEAARAYDEEAKRLFGTYARTNAMLGLL